MDKSQFEQQLAAIFDFTREDLAHNQMGLLSPRQRKMLNTWNEQQKGDSGCMIGVGLIIACGIVGLMTPFLADAGGLSGVTPFVLVCSVPIILSAISAVSNNANAKRDMAGGRVDVLEGPIGLATLRELEPYRRHRHNAYYFTVGNRKINISLYRHRDLKAVFQPGYGARVYVTPKTQRILSIELVKWYDLGRS